MTIKELEDKLGMARANIRYYEQENLIKPMRKKNGYRDYSEEDIICLKKIKLLRELGVSLADIQKLQSGKLTLSEEMRHRIEALGQQSQAMGQAAIVCMDIQQKAVSYQQLDADRYLNGAFLATLTNSSAAPEPAMQEELSENLPEIIAPTCRFLARIFDIVLFQEIAICVISLCHMNCPSLLTSPVMAGMLQLLWLFIEPLCIHFTGTTIGKWIFGIRLTDIAYEGRRLSYHAALLRTWKVFVFGMGLNLPVLSLYCMYKSYQAASDGWKSMWDDEVAYSQRPSRFAGGSRRYILLAAACLASFVITYGCTLYARIPIHRGNLTLEEFVENYNQAARYLGYSEYFYQLKPDGTFYTSEEAYQLRADQANASGVFSIDLFGDYKMFDFSYSFDGKYLTQVSLHIAVKNYCEEPYILYPRVPMAIAAHAFAGAQDGIHFWKDERGRMIEKLMGTGFAESFSYQMGGMDVMCDVKCTGFGSIMDYLTAGREDNEFFLEFTVGTE